MALYKQIISLVSDFGLKDASVAIVKGLLFSKLPDVNVIDINHEIKPFDLPDAAYFINASCAQFSPKTIHLILVDIFYSASPAMILFEANEQYFLCPDNGIATQIKCFDPNKVWKCAQFDNSSTFIDWINESLRIIQVLQTQTDATAQFTPAISGIIKNHDTTKNTDDTIHCDIVHIDRFENVVLSCTRSEFDAKGQGRSFVLHFKQTETIIRLSKSHHEVREGDKLCRFNSNGHLEICINKGKASTLFGLRQGSPNNEIKIIFQ